MCAFSSFTIFKPVNSCSIEPEHCIQAVPPDLQCTAKNKMQIEKKNFWGQSIS